MYGRPKRPPSHPRPVQRPAGSAGDHPLADVKLLDDNDGWRGGAGGRDRREGAMVFTATGTCLKTRPTPSAAAGTHGDMGRFDEDGFLFYAGRKPEKS